jgi:hypothetical protein
MDEIIEVELPDGRILKFPSSMNPEEMRKHAVKAMQGGGEIQGGRNVRGFKDGLRPDKMGDKSNMLLGAAGAGAALAGPEILPMLAALFGKLGGKVPPSAPGNVEKLTHEAFDLVGKEGANVTKMDPTSAIKGGDRLTNILFGGVSPVKDSYIPPAARSAISPEELKQMVVNLKEVGSTAVKEGVTRRRSPK